MYLIKISLLYGNLMCQKEKRDYTYYCCDLQLLYACVKLVMMREKKEPFEYEILFVFSGTFYLLFFSC